MSARDAIGLGPLDRPRVLIVRLGAIGDVVNALIVANGIRSAVPGALIGWAIHPLSKPLVEGHPAVDRIHVWSKGTGLRGFRKVVRDVRDGGYDIALDLQRLQKSALLARLSGARRVIGFDRPRCKEQSWLWTKERIETGHPREHMVLQYRRFLDLLGLPSDPVRRDLTADPKSTAWAEGWIADKWGGEAPILLNVGASKQEKLWPEASFREVAEHLRRELPDTPIAITGGPGDIKMGQSLRSAVPSLFQLAGETSIVELVALIRKARGVITGDTGAMHVAAAVGTPTVAIFGPSDPVRTGPFGSRHAVLQGNRRLSEADLAQGHGSVPPPRTRPPMGATTPGVVSVQASELFGRAIDPI